MRQGHYVEMIATESEGACFNRCRENDIPAKCYPAKKSFSWRTHMACIGRELIAGNYDAVILNHARLAQASLGMLPESVVAIPIIHNDSESVYAVACGNREAWNVAVAVSHRVFLQARKILGNKPVVEIPQGVYLPNFAARRTPLPEAGLRLAFVGRLTEPQKGVLLLPEIFDRCRKLGVNARMSVIGDGPDRLALVNKIRHYRAENEIRLLGSLPPEAVLQHLLDSDILLMPSRSEGFGIVMLEAMACGCVPIVSRLEGITDTVIRDGETGFLIPPDNVPMFAEAVITLRKNTELLQQMSSNVRRHVEACFSMDRMGGAYLRLIESGLSGEYPLSRARASQGSLDQSLVQRADYVPNIFRPLLLRVAPRMRTILDKL